MLTIKTSATLCSCDLGQVSFTSGAVSSAKEKKYMSSIAPVDWEEPPSALPMPFCELQ